MRSTSSSRRDSSQSVRPSWARLKAAALGFVFAVVAEIVVGLELVLELAHAQLDHHRVVEEAQHFDIVRDDVLRVAEVHERRQYALAVFFRQVPALVAHHGDHVVQAQQAFLDEVGDVDLCASASSVPEQEMMSSAVRSLADSLPPPSPSGNVRGRGR
jgi:hypothetical protein